jgi:predicted amidohydrolase YtcJ
MERRDLLKSALAFGVGAPRLARQPAPREGLALVNARLVTMDPEKPEAQAALVRGGRIALVGTTAEVRREAKGAPELDAAGKVVVPGFVDAHTHFELTCISASFQAACHTPPLKSVREILQVLKAEAADTPQGEWVIGRSSFGLRNKVEEHSLPNRHDLDAITVDHPLVLFSGLHVAMMNTRAIRELGLWDRASNPPRGMALELEEAGTPSGIATEVWDLLPAYSPEKVALALRAHAKEIFVSKGTTSLSTVPQGSDDIRVDQELQASGELPLRLRIYYHVPRVISLDALLATGPRSGLGDDRFRFGGIKIFVNGTTADDYKFTQDELDDFVFRAHAAGIQVLMHVLSRGALLMAATSMERALKRHPAPHRHRLEHSGDRLESLEDMRRLRDIGLRVVSTPHFGRRPGTAEKVPRFRTMIAERLEPIAVTDSTGTVPEASGPLFNIACAMTSRAQGGSAADGEEVTFEEALRMHTRWPAHASYEERDKGSITAGKLGDFAILSADPRGRPGKEVFDIDVDTTILGGEAVFERS